MWTIRKIAMNDFGREHWDNDDTIDYVRLNRSVIRSYSNNFDDHHQTIESFDEDDDDDDDNINNSYGGRGPNQPWNAYQYDTGLFTIFMNSIVILISFLIRI